MPGEVPSGWQATSLGVLCEIVGGTTPARAEAAYWNGPIPWASPTDVTALAAGEMTIRCTADAITERGLRESSLSLLPPGTVLMTSRATIGEAVVAAMPMTTNQGFCNFLPSANFDAYFLAYWLRHHTDRLRSLAAGSTFLEINRGVLRKLGIALPPLPEQKKIAAILSSVDEAIQATQAVIDQTRRVKEGLLQDLLTRGIGHTRFKQTEIGEIPEGWEVRRLGDVVEPLFDDCTLEPDVAYFPAIVRRRHRGVDFPESRLGAEILVKDQYRVHPGTVLFSKRQLVHGATGLIGPTVPATAIMSKEYYQLRGVRGLSTQFLSYWTRTSAFQNIAERCTYGVDREKFVVNERWFFSSPTPVPPLDEQAAIVTSLDGLDSVVSENNGRLSALQSVKSGLLQDLLTGKVRVTP